MDSQNISGPATSTPVSSPAKKKRKKDDSSYKDKDEDEIMSPYSLNKVYDLCMINRKDHFISSFLEALNVYELIEYDKSLGDNNIYFKEENDTSQQFSELYKIFTYFSLRMKRITKFIEDKRKERFDQAYKDKDKDKDYDRKQNNEDRLLSFQDSFMKNFRSLSYYLILKMCEKSEKISYIIDTNKDLSEKIKNSTDNEEIKQYADFYKKKMDAIRDYIKQSNMNDEDKQKPLASLMQEKNSYEESDDEEMVNNNIKDFFKDHGKDLDTTDIQNLSYESHKVEYKLSPFPQELKFWEPYLMDNGKGIIFLYLPAMEENYNQNDDSKKNIELDHLLRREIVYIELPRYIHNIKTATLDHLICPITKVDRVGSNFMDEDVFLKKSTIQGEINKIKKLYKKLSDTHIQ